MKRFKRIICLVVAIVSLTVYTSCINLTSSKEVEVINGVTQNKIITATFSVDVYKSIFTSYNKIAKGSAVLYKKEELENDEYKYYLLTNNHVVYSGNYFIVNDCFGNEITATVYKKDANYDLAILTFNAVADYTVLNVSSSDAIVNQRVVAIGCPNGQINAVTLGKITEHTTVEVDNAKKEECNVTFSVLQHNAPIYSGSSGGVLLDYSYDIVGINFACIIEEEQFVSGYAVPSSKVQEFINS